MALAITPTPERLHDGFTVLCPVGQLLLALKALLANQRFVPIDPAPLLATLASIIVILGHFLGRLEGWSKFDALYHAFITATTVGYGDFHPSKKRSKVLAIVITFVGIVFTGILVAIALHSAAHAFKETHDADKLVEQVDE